MGLRDLSIQSVFIVPQDDLATGLLIPCMSESTDVRCMAGFFNSSSFMHLAPGIATYINSGYGPYKLLISPKINEEDRNAFESATKHPEAILADAAELLLSDGRLSESALIQHTLKCLEYLLVTGRLVVRFVLMRQGMFHPKVWLFGDSQDSLVAHGSSNPTSAGLMHNLETITIERSWKEQDKVCKFLNLFEQIWEGKGHESITIDFPEGLRFAENIDNKWCPTMNDFWKAWHQDAKKGLMPRLPHSTSIPKIQYEVQQLAIPTELEWESGSFGHQGEAVLSWESNRKGILAIATGGGKTITSLIAATRLQNFYSPLLVVISAPYKPLISQWKREIKEFGINHVPIEGLSPTERETRLQQVNLALAGGGVKVEVIVISNRMLTSDKFREFLNAIPNSIKTLLIADEVHNLGSSGFISNPPSRFDFRLGLSATPIRQYDDEGTESLLNFFGEVVFEFKLEQAIRAGCLTKYNYYLHPVTLSEDELHEWGELTERLRVLGYKSNEDTCGQALDKSIKLLLIRRRGIVENADSKVSLLRQLLEIIGVNSIRNTLIYTSAKYSSGQTKQIVRVNRLLNELGILSHMLTSKETGNGHAQEILEDFRLEKYKVLTCMKVLDEGVDIPQTESAFIMASSTVTREWVQRRGRILRKKQGKQLAHLHDFLVVPSDPHCPSERAILRQELKRAREFTRLAKNSGAENGPWEVISNLNSILK